MSSHGHTAGEVACLFFSVLLEGLQRMAGLFFLETVQVTGSDRQAAALPFTLSWAVAGILSGILKYTVTKGQTYSMIGGCVLAAVGMGLCFTAESLVSLILFWGLIFGSGIGIISPLITRVLNSSYFADSFSTICFISSNSGCIILPFLIDLVIGNWGIYGCYLILSGIILNCLPLILIYKFNIRFAFPKVKLPIRKKSKQYNLSTRKVNDAANCSYKVKKTSEAINEDIFINMESDSTHNISDMASSKGSQTSSEYLEDFQRNSEKSESVNSQMTVDSAHSQGSSLMSSKNSEFDKCLDKVSQEPDFAATGISAHFVSDQLCSTCKLQNDNSIAEKTAQCVCNNIIEPENIKMRCSVNVKCHKSSKTARNSHLQSIVEQAENNSQINPNKLNFDTSPQSDFKVRVVECTFPSKELLIANMLTQNTNFANKGYRKRSNSIIPGTYDHIDFSKVLDFKPKADFPFFSKRNPVPNMYLISENAEQDCDDIPVNSDEPRIFSTWVERFKNLVHESKRVLQPSCLVILYASVIYEFTLVTLLMVFADFTQDVEGSEVHPRVVMTSFGIGGVLGGVCFTQWGHRLLMDGAPAATALAFMLNGLMVAGVLWSSNICWIAGFYGILGFLENAILMSIRKLTFDYVDGGAKVLLSSLSDCLSGLGILLLPLAIGLSRDDSGRYDSLLQMCSFLSVLCAVITYFLPHLTPRPRQMNLP